MKFMSNLAQTTCKFAMGMLMILPLFAIPIQSYAETDADKDVEFSQAELDQMLAPIALYPDTVLSQILIASTYPIEIVQADRWAMSHKEVKGEEAVRLVEDKDWDPSIKALVAFPDILERMSDDIDWTQRLGDAFLSDENQVMDTVQNLRKKAYASGSLSKVQHLKVERDDDEIIIEPAQERVIYVPVYDTRVVYGNWWWRDYPPVYWHHPSSYTHVSGFYWGPSIYIGPTYFYSSCRWNERRVVVVDRHYHSNAPHFYTSRSISRYQGAREWRHDPVHRRGVAYYNNNLRNTYGSRHESNRDARVYRENHSQNRNDNIYRGNDGFKNNPRLIQPQNQGRNPENNARPTVDRAEQLRVRMNNQNQNVGPNENVNRSNVNRLNVDRGIQRNNEQRDNQRIERTNNGQQIDRNFTRKYDNATPTVTSTEASHAERNERITRFNRPTQTERAPTTVNPSVERVQNVDRSNVDRSNVDRGNIDRGNVDRNVNNRATRVDDSMNRRVQEQREAPRVERGNTDSGNRGVRGRDNIDRQ